MFGVGSDVLSTKKEIEREGGKFFVNESAEKRGKKEKKKALNEIEYICATAVKNTHFILVSALTHTPVRGVSFIDDESELAFDPNDDESELLRLLFSPTFVVVSKPCS